MYVETCFDSYFDPIEGKFYPSSEDYKGERNPQYHIKDCYEVSITQDHEDSNFRVFEKSRIKKFALDNNLSTPDLHINGDGDLCVAPKNTEYYRLYSKEKDLFITKLLIPFLYAHSFYETHRKRPWPDYSHNTDGNFEAYHREKVLATKEGVIRNIFCLKDANFTIKDLAQESPSFLEPLRKRTEEGFLGATKLIKDIKTFGLEKHLG